MANNVVITAADSPTVVFGSALDNTQTDNFFNFGAGNTIEWRRRKHQRHRLGDRQQHDG